MTYLLIGVVLVVSAYVVYSAMTPEGLDWYKGLAAATAAAAAIWAWLTGLFHSAPPV